MTILDSGLEGVLCNKGVTGYTKPNLAFYKNIREGGFRMFNANILLIIKISLVSAATTIIIKALLLSIISPFFFLSKFIL